MIVTTEAIVLKSMKYRDSSKILTLYTRQFGKISVLAKAARDRKSKFGSSLEPMCYVTAVVYWKEGRDLQLLSQCDLAAHLRFLSEDMEKMACAMGVIELLNAVTHGEEQNERLFQLTLEALRAINTATKSVLLALYTFEVRLLDILGFRPNFHECFHCGQTLDAPGTGGGKMGMHISAGGVFCSNCRMQHLGLQDISFSALKVLQRMQEISSVEPITRLLVSAGTAEEIRSVLRRYFQSHIDGLRVLKAEGVFASIL